MRIRARVSIGRRGARRRRYHTRRRAAAARAARARGCREVAVKRRLPLLLVVPAMLLLGCSVPVVKPGWQDQAGAELKELALNGAPAAELSATVRFIPGD